MKQIDLTEKEIDRLHVIHNNSTEADIYQYDNNHILKLYKIKDELYLLKKLYKMTALEEVVLPDNLVLPSASIFINESFQGFLMPYIPTTQHLLDIDNESIEEKIHILKQLSDTLKQCHSKQVVFGDYQPDNILIHNKKPYHVDVDSVQYKGYTDDTISKLLYHIGQTTPSRKTDIISYHYYAFYLLTGILLDESNPHSWKSIIKQTYFPQNIKNIFMNMLDLPKGIYLGDYIGELQGEKPKEELQITLIRRLFS